MRIRCRENVREAEVIAHQLHYVAMTRSLWISLNSDSSASSSPFQDLEKLQAVKQQNAGDAKGQIFTAGAMVSIESTGGRSDERLR